MSALRPCPFCDGEARRITIGDDEPSNTGGDVIVCTECGASSHVEFGRKENLVSCWNRRAVNAHDELVEALRKAIGWFEQYAAEHYAKAKNAPDFREQHGREVKGKTNADRAAELRAALSKALGNDGGEG